MKKVLVYLAVATAPMFAHAGLLDSALEDIGVWHHSDTSSQSASKFGPNDGHEYRRPYSHEHGGVRKAGYGGVATITGTRTRRRAMRLIIAP